MVYCLVYGRERRMSASGWLRSGAPIVSTVSFLAATMTVWVFAGDEKPASSIAPPGARTTKSLPANESINKPYGSHLGPILTHISANNEQRDKITAIVQNFRPRIEPLKNQCSELNRTYLNAVIRGAPSEAIMEQQSKLSQVNQQMCAQYCLMSLEIRRLLTPDQVRLYEEYRQRQGWSCKR